MKILKYWNVLLLFTVILYSMLLFLAVVKDSYSFKYFGKVRS